MNYQEEKKLFKELAADPNNLVFWKRDIAYQCDSGIVTEKRWTTGEHYLIDDRLYPLGSSIELCKSWITEEYLNEMCNGQNIVIVTE